MKSEANGIEIGYDLSGEGPDLVLCHALGLDRTMWFGQVPEFAGRHRVLAWDARGHGDSTKAAGPYDFDLMARDLEGLLDALGIERAAVLGLSMGGHIAISFGSLFPERTSALLLCDTTAWYGPEASRGFLERIDAVRKGGLDPLLPAQAGRWFTEQFRAAHPETVERVMATLGRADEGGYIATLRALSELDQRPRLAVIECPTLVLVGRNDPVAPVRMAADLRDGIAGASLRVIEGAKHMAPVERPDQFNEAVLEFLSSL